MDSPAVLEQIERVSEKLLLAQPSELDVLASLHTDVSALAVWAESESMALPSRALKSAADLIEQIVLGEISDPARAMSIIGNGLGAFQTVVRDGRKVEEVLFPPELLGQPLDVSPPGGGR